MESAGSPLLLRVHPKESSGGGFLWLRNKTLKFRDITDGFFLDTMYNFV